MIIVPAMQVAGNVSLSNIRRFLEDGFYEEEPPQTGNFLTTSQSVSVTRKIGNKTVTFDVYDSTTNFTDSRWNRIVAVFVNG